MDTFQYYQTIEYTACDQEVYQQDIVIHRTEGEPYEETVAGFNIWHIYVGNRCKEDYGDIRFTNSADVELNYYLWPDYTSDCAKFCVRLVGMTCTGTLTVWYGNPVVESESGGDNTFPFFNNFERQTTENWVAVASGTTLTLPSHNDGNALKIYKSHTGYGATDYASAYKTVSLPSGSYKLSIFVKAHRHWEGDSYSTYYRIEYGGNVLKSRGLSPPTGETLSLNINSDGQSGNLFIYGDAYGFYNSAEILIDDVIIRAYSATPPSVISFSSEISPPIQSRDNNKENAIFGNLSIMIV